MIERVESEYEGRKLIGNLFMHNGSSDSIVILLHGFLSSKEDMFFIADALQKEGLDSFAIDMNGHGEDHRNFSEFTISKAIADCNTAIGHALSKGYKRIGVFGFSIGGFIALNTALENKEVKSLVLGAPVSNFQSLFEGVDLKEWKDTGVLHSPSMGVHIKLDYEFYTDGLQYDGYTRFSKIKQPTLIIHGTSDGVVPIAQSEQLAHSLANAHLLRITGATHDSLFNASEPLDSLIKWFKATL